MDVVAREVCAAPVVLAVATNCCGGMDGNDLYHGILCFHDIPCQMGEDELATGDAARRVALADAVVAGLFHKTHITGTNT